MRSGIADEVGREITAVKLHTVDGLQLGHHGLRLFDRDDAVFADLLHRFGNDVADGGIAVGGNGANLSDRIAGNGLRELLDFFDDRLDRLLDAALQSHRIGAGGYRLHAFAENRLSQNRRGGRAVAGDVGGLRSNLAHHLGAHVFERILELDFFGNRHTVFGDRRSTELLFENNIAALGTECDLHGISKLIHAAKNRLTRIFAINNLFCSHIILLCLLTFWQCHW